MQGHVRLEEFGLGAELTWDARQSTRLETKELGKQTTDGPGIYGKQIKIKS